MEEIKKRKMPTRVRSLSARKDNGKSIREQNRTLKKLEKEEKQISEQITSKTKSESMSQSFSELDKDQALLRAKREIHMLTTRVTDQNAKARDDLNTIKSLHQILNETNIRFEAKLTQIQEQYNEQLKQKDEIYKQSLAQIKEQHQEILAVLKSQFQERILFLQELLANSQSKDPLAVQSRYFKDFNKYHKLFADETINDDLLDQLAEQTQDLDEIQLRALKTQVRQKEFWTWYDKLRVPQFAAYISRVISGNPTKQRIDFVTTCLTKYAQIYQNLKVDYFDESIISKAYIHANENKEIFGNLKEASSIDQAAKVIKSVGKTICGIEGVKYKVGRKSQPKDLVDFDNFVQCVMKVKDSGYDIPGINQYSSRLFGFFLALCLVTGQRNRTVREVKFEDFSQSKGQYFLSLFATKTRKACKYRIQEGAFRQVEKIKDAREWMKEEANKTEQELEEKQMSENHAKILREKLAGLERRIDHVFPFFHGSAVHWHAARFREYMINQKIENAACFTIHTVRAIALTQIAYNPNAAMQFAQHSSVNTTTRHYVLDPFRRDMIEGLDFQNIVEPCEDEYIEMLMKRQKKDEEYDEAVQLHGSDIEDSD